MVNPLAKTVNVRRGLALAGALLLGNSLQADVVAWWRFDTIGADRKVVNAANPGTCDGYLTTGTQPGTDGTWPANAANMPIVTNSFPLALPRVIDQLTGAVTNSGKALLWNGTAVKGGVVVPYEDAKGLLELEKFTIEAFVRLPPEAASRTTNQMFPIVHFGSDANRGFMFSVWDNSMSKGYLFFRENGTAWDVWKQHAAHMPGLYDGRWHHVAVAFDGYATTKKASMYLYVDGRKYAGFSNQNWNGWDAVKTNKDPLVIGRHQGQDSRTFMGEIAEVRISDTLLENDQFLVPLVDRPALTDDDTALMLTFDTAKSTGYGFTAQHVVPCINSGKTNYTWAARNWNLLNAAVRAPLVPRWYPLDTIGRVDYLSETLRPLQDDAAVPGEGLYGSAFGAAADAEGASLRIRTDGGNNADVLNVPGASALAADSLTVELFFKTEIADDNTDTLVYGGFIKWCIYQGKLLARTFQNPDQNSGSGSVQHQTTMKVNDGAWHHAAYVFDKASGVVSHYLDYKLQGRYKATPYLDGSLSFLIGGERRDYQAFAGNIDDVRITRRALRPWEFLTTHAAGTNLVMDAALEGDYSSGVDASIAPAGTAGTLIANETSGEAVLPEIVKTREGFVTLDGEVCQATRASGHALRLDGGYVKWPYNRLLDRQDLTVEFFARFDKLEHSANLVRLSDGTDWGTNPPWTLWYGIYSGVPDVRVTANTTTNGGISVTSASVFFHQGAEDDGKWHHWAMTTEADATGSNTVFTLYKDYVQHGNVVTVVGLLRFPSNGVNLSVQRREPVRRRHERARGVHPRAGEQPAHLARRAADERVHALHPEGGGRVSCVLVGMVIFRYNNNQINEQKGCFR